MLDIWGLEKLLNRFYQFLAPDQTIIWKACAFHFNKLSYRLTDIFDIKSLIGTGVHIYGITELENV